MSSDDKLPQLGAGILVHRKIRRRREGEGPEEDGERPGTGEYDALQGPPSRAGVAAPPSAAWSAELDPFGDDPFALDPFAPDPFAPAPPSPAPAPAPAPRPPEPAPTPVVPRAFLAEPEIDPALDTTYAPGVEWTRDRATVEFRPPPDMLDGEGFSGLEDAADFFDDEPSAPPPPRASSFLPVVPRLHDPFSDSLLELEPLPDSPPMPQAPAAPSPPPPAPLDPFSWEDDPWEEPDAPLAAMDELDDDLGAELDALLGDAPSSSSDGDSVLDLSEEHRIAPLLSAPGPIAPPPPLSRALNHRSDAWQQEALEELNARVASLEARPLAAAEPPRLGILAPRWGTPDAQDGVITAGLELVHEVDGWLRAALLARADGLVLAVGACPVLQRDGGLEPALCEGLDAARWEALLRPICSARAWAALQREGALTLEHALPEQGRFLVHLTWSPAGEHVAVFRRQLSALVSLLDLGLPPAAEHLLTLRAGLVILCGPLGSGRRAVAAALLRGWEARHDLRALVLDPHPRFDLAALGLRAVERMPRLHAPDEEALLHALRAEHPEILLSVDLASPRLAAAAVEQAWDGGLACLVLRAPTLEAALDQLHGGDPHLRDDLLEVLAGFASLRRVPLLHGGEALAAAAALVTEPLAAALAAGRSAEAWLDEHPAPHQQSLAATLRAWQQRGWTPPGA